ncbi:MAG: aminotransferase class I/II-fold pyridoxal phosphate-dependent enzyme [Crocinitomix sp.]|nr:aminotransferase class I/II-fold pyridoxal phosphate-dependent enzyme [Crocinitomix sp.]
MKKELRIFENLKKKSRSEDFNCSYDDSLLKPGINTFSNLPCGIDDWTLDVFRRAKNPSDPIELRDLWIGRTEQMLGNKKKRPELAEKWKSANIERSITAEEVLCSNTTVKFVKEIFNFYFRDDLYGVLSSDDHIILSSGAVCEESWGLPEVLKECILFALQKNWYGYSDSRGRDSTRNAVAIFENSKLQAETYSLENIVITIGATFAISSISDFILKKNKDMNSPALCLIPNYPPLVESVAMRHDVKLVPMEAHEGRSSIKSLIRELRPDTPLVLLQTAINPSGTLVDEAEIEELIRTASPSTMIILDECHEWLGPKIRLSNLRSAANVIRVSSLSKPWSAPGVKCGWFIADESFVKDYYEHASSTYGGPPSIYYTMIEFLAKMEAWINQGVELPEMKHVLEFDSSYNLNLGLIQNAYLNYKAERNEVKQELNCQRDTTVSKFGQMPVNIIQPKYSINMALEFPQYNDSYLCFREVLHDTSVSMYPGILNFCFTGAVERITIARPWEDISKASDRIQNCLSKGVEIS